MLQLSRTVRHYATHLWKQFSNSLDKAEYQQVPRHSHSPGCSPRDWAFRDMRKDAYKTWLVMQRRPHLKRMTKVQQWKSGWTGMACSYKNEHVTAIQDMEGQSQRQKMVSENNESAKDDRWPHCQEAQKWTSWTAESPETSLIHWTVCVWGFGVI